MYRAVLVSDMTTAVLYLRLEGPLQSWGDRSTFWSRQTSVFPTKSGVIGMLFCAMGWGGPREAELAEVASLPMTAYRVGPQEKARTPILSDFHMVGAHYDDSDPWQLECIPKTSEGKKAVGGGTRLTRREFLQDEAFAVLVRVPSAWKEPLAQGLTQPVWDIYLGRKTCAPSKPVFGGFFGDETTAKAFLEEELKHRSEENGSSWVLLESQEETTTSDPLGERMFDVPISFGKAKKYSTRRVITKSLT